MHIIQFFNKHSFADHAKIACVVYIAEHMGLWAHVEYD